MAEPAASGLDEGGPPLSDVRVLELTTSLAGQTAGLLLADLGADVVQVSASPPPAIGDQELAGWLFRNRGKRLTRVESWSEVGTAGAGLLGAADVLITDLGPAELDRVGLNSDAIATSAPGCIHTWLPPVAATGRWSGLPHDQLLLDGLSGFASYVPAHEDRPVASIGSIRPVLQGALGAAHAVIELAGRERTGAIGPVVVGGLRAVAMANHLLMIGGTDGPLVYSANKRIEANAHYRFYQAADGRWLFVGALGEVMLIEALTVLDRLDILARPDMGGEFGRLLVPEVTDAVGRELESTFRARTAADWVDRFERADVPVAPALEREHWLRSDMVAHACPPVTVHHDEVGALTMPGVPLALASTALPAGAVPRTTDVVELAAVSERWTDRGAEVRPVRRRAGPPLSGCPVVEMALFVAAPVIGSLLAGAGAEVVKVEPLSGDPYRSYGAAFATLNHGKRLARIDVSRPDGRDELLRLAAASEVLIDNLRPASLDRLGLTDPVVEAAAPGLVRASVTAFGQSGPWVGRPAFDPIIQAVSGMAVAQGGDDRPVGTSSPPHDVTTGVLGALGVAAALYRHRRGGSGDRIFVSLVASSTLLQADELTTYPGRAESAVGGRDHPGPSPWHRYYEASDGWLAIWARTDRERRAVTAALGAGPPPEGSPELSGWLGRAFAGSTVAHWVDRLQAVGVPAVPVLERGQFDTAALAGTGYFREIETEELGRLRVLAPFGHGREDRDEGDEPDEASRIG